MFHRPFLSSSCPLVFTLYRGRLCVRTFAAKMRIRSFKQLAVEFYVEFLVHDCHDFCQQKLLPLPRETKLHQDRHRNERLFTKQMTEE